MGVDSAHFVQETLGDTGDHVENETLNCAQACDVFAAALPDCKSHLVCFALEEADVHVDMADVLGQRPPWSCDIDDAGFDGDIDALGNVELFVLDNVSHL